MRKCRAAAPLEAANEVLTYLSFPPEHRTKLHPTNVVERLSRELKTRTLVVSIFPNRESLCRLVGAVLLEEHDEWRVARRYISEQSMKALTEHRAIAGSRVTVPARAGLPGASIGAPGSCQYWKVIERIERPPVTGS